MVIHGRRLIGIGGLVLAACGPSTADPSDQRTVAAVARASGSAVVVFLNQQNASHIPDIETGSKPGGFQWMAVRAGASRADELFANGSTHIDLTNANDGTVFQQDYASECNPALDDRRVCWVYEEYRAGDLGLSGYIDLKLTTAIANGGLDVIWSGMTDRFGPPTQQLTHETTMDIAGAISGGTP